MTDGLIDDNTHSGIANDTDTYVSPSYRTTPHQTSIDYGGTRSRLLDWVMNQHPQPTLFSHFRRSEIRDARVTAITYQCTPLMGP